MKQIRKNNLEKDFPKNLMKSLGRGVTGYENEKIVFGKKEDI